MICTYIYFRYKRQTFIIGFYLISNLHYSINQEIKKSYLISRQNKKIKINFFSIEYCNSWLMICIFRNKLRKFRILIFKNQLCELEHFKKLIILNKYKFLP